MGGTEQMGEDTKILKRGGGGKLGLPDDGRSISRNVASLNIRVHDVIN